MPQYIAENIPLSQAFSEQLAFARQQVALLNQQRIERTLQKSDATLGEIFQLIPLLIHYNHPQLPAYVENAPLGVANFTLTEFQQHYLNTFEIKDPPQETTFAGVYAMGSIGSISQTSLSDLDIWLCYQCSLSTEQQVLIEQKCECLCEWANQQGVEVNFYLMNPDLFRQRLYLEDVEEEHSGSAQHFLLLDEFYRSAILLAGKPLLWWHLLEDNQQSYQEKVANAVEKGWINLDEWIDFGCFSQLSANEFFGASLWQLYKGIDAPYKSAIKILLLESYTETYPNTELISMQFKQKLLIENDLNYHFDPYLAMLDKVSDYLTTRKELGRLEYLRCCFYLKASENLTSDSQKWQDLQQLTTSWGWTEKEVGWLNQRSQWKIKIAMKQQRMLVEQLLQSYRHLILFARKFQIDPSILPNDADILMRKLYSAFEVLPGKVPLINPRISHNLEEQAVTFVEVNPGGALASGWYMVNQAPKTPYASQNRHIQHHKTLNKLVAWAYFNGLITAKTEIHLISRNIDLSKLRQFITDLRLTFPAIAPPMTKEDLYHPNEIRNLIVMINLVKDPTLSIQKNTPISLSISELFQLNSSQPQLIGSINLIYRNVWNEIRTHHFEGANAVLNALKLISNKIYRGKAPPQSVNVFCYSKYYHTELRNFITDLVQHCISIQLNTVAPSLSNTQEQRWQALFSPIDQAANYVSKYPKQIDHFACEGFLQFFFEDCTYNQFNVYILDEKNCLVAYFNCQGKKEEKIKAINRLYAVKHLQHSATESFNFPQFYQLLKQDQQYIIVPYHSQQHRDYINTSETAKQIH